MNRISITYTLKWEYKECPYYKLTECGKFINMRTGESIKTMFEWWEYRLLDREKIYNN